jgi:23S rRNA (adenine2503-C2)-methyltransferase
MQTHKIPTGYLFTDDYSKGQLETLSIGDYGKSVNIKADFLGFTNPINGVPNTVCKPLSEKWVITLSTQFGCSMACTFCDCPKIKFKGNATFDDLKQQFYNAIKLFPNVKYTDRMNLHFARMGEPIFNIDVFRFSCWLAKNKLEIYTDTGLRIETLHPVLTTSCPNMFSGFHQRILDWCNIKNEVFNGQAGLQLSINSTDDQQRQEMFNSKTLTLDQLSELCKTLPMPLGRKYCLNFAYASSFKVDAQKLVSLFDPDYFMVKITPIHNNEACRENKIETVGGYNEYTPYQMVEEDLKSVGFDVLVFVPSMDEENGLVTCGNAILSGSKITC